MNRQWRPRHIAVLAGFAGLLLAGFASGGCIRVKVEPIHITADVNVTVKVDKELDNFFGDLDAKSAKP